MYICYLLHALTTFVFIKHQFGLTAATVINGENGVNSFFRLHAKQMKNVPIIKRETLAAQSYDASNEMKSLNSLENNLAVSQEVHNVYGSDNLTNSQEKATFRTVPDSASAIKSGLSEENITEELKFKAIPVNGSTAHHEISATNINSSTVFKSRNPIVLEDQTEPQIALEHLPRSDGLLPSLNEVNNMSPNIYHHYSPMLSQPIIVNPNSIYRRGNNAEYIYMQAPPEVHIASSTNYGLPSERDVEYLKNPVFLMTPKNEQLMLNDSYLVHNSNSAYNIKPVFLSAQESFHSPGVMNGHAGVTYQQVPFTAPNVIFQRIPDFPVNSTEYEEREENTTKTIHPREVPQAAVSVQTKASNPVTLPKLVPPLSLVPKEETELERAERVNKAFERMIQFVNILGQVDSYITDRAKTAVRKLALLYEDDDNDDRYYSRSRRRRH